MKIQLKFPLCVIRGFSEIILYALHSTPDILNEKKKHIIPDTSA